MDFAALAACARHEIAATTASKALTVPEPVTQADFLLAVGLLDRAGQLGTGKSHEEQDAIRDAVERLAGPEQMGNLFKIMAILPIEVTIPPFYQD